ncbi:hypothetical protein HX747_27470 [Streptomyces sp. L06]|nr:hypothetical protein [Streptomyces sp. L06]
MLSFACTPGVVSQSGGVNGEVRVAVAGAEGAYVREVGHGREVAGAGAGLHGPPAAEGGRAVVMRIPLVVRPGDRSDGQAGIAQGLRRND